MQQLHNHLSVSTIKVRGKRRINKLNYCNTRPPFWGDNVQSHILKMDQKKISAWGCVGGELSVFLVKKDCKRKFGFEDSISNVDLSSATKPPINV